MEVITIAAIYGIPDADLKTISIILVAVAVEAADVMIGPRTIAVATVKVGITVISAAEKVSSSNFSSIAGRSFFSQ